MLAQTENTVKIEGILSEINLEPKTITKNGVEVKAVSGTIKVRVDQNANDVESTLEIPIHMFSTEFTNDGRTNPAYESITRVMNEYSSIAAVGIDAADRVRITRASIEMNEYYNRNGALVSFPRIKASFVNKITKDECKPKAEFNVVFAIGSLGYETDKDGVETSRYKVNAILPQYGGKVDIVPFYAVRQSVIDGIQSNWNVGDTVRAVGRLNFTSKTETLSVSLGFGESSEQTRTVSVSDLIITGGNPTPMDGEFALDSNELQAALSERKARLATMKEKDSTKATQKPAANKFKDLGF